MGVHTRVLRSARDARTKISYWDAEKKPKRLMLTRDESDEANKMVITVCIVGCSKIEVVYLQ